MVRFLADASLRHAIVTGCVRREPAIDFLSAHAAKLHGVGDGAVLDIAAMQGRVLVSQDFRTMPRHFAEFISAGRSSPGVFMVKQRTPLAAIIDAPAGLDGILAGGLDQSDRRNPISLKNHGRPRRQS